jgi:putative PIN family toxin of toxin-antitoxin system
MALWLDDQFLLVLSQPIVDEVERVVSRPHLIRKYRYTAEAIANLMDLLMHRTVIVEAPFSHQLCRDADDDHVVDCAIWGRVQFLVSYDKDLSDDSDLRRALFEFGIAVSTPEVFAERLEEELVV